IHRTFDRVPDSIDAPAEKSGDIVGVYCIFTKTFAQQENGIPFPLRRMSFIAESYVESCEIRSAHTHLASLAGFFSKLYLVVHRLRRGNDLLDIDQDAAIERVCLQSHATDVNSVFVQPQDRGGQFL